MKDKAAARAATTATAVATQSNSDFDHHPPETAECEKDTFSESKINNDTESSKNNIAELQRQLLNKLSKTEKSPGQRQKDTFAEFMKEVTYTFPPAMWLKFQSEVNSLMQKYQYELHQESSMQTQRQQQDEFHRPYSPNRVTGPGSQQYPSMGWQPHPSQWPPQVYRPTSVWGSQEANWVQQQYQDQPQFTAPTYSASTPLRRPSSTSYQSNDIGNLTSLSDVSIGSFSHLLNTNQADDNRDLSTPRSVVHPATLTQQPEYSEQGIVSQD